MQAIIGLVIGLIVINVVVLILVGLVTFDNPLRAGTLGIVALANCGVFFFSALIGSDSPGRSMSSLGSRLLPER